MPAAYAAGSQRGATHMRIFLSHTAQDHAFCDQLAQALRAAGADVFYDESSETTGLRGRIIERELRRRGVFIVILSPAAHASAQVEDETRRLSCFLFLLSLSLRPTSGLTFSSFGA